MSLPKVYLVDDLESLRIVLGFAFEGHFDLTCFATTTEAEKAIALNPPDAILLDIHIDQAPTTYDVLNNEGNGFVCLARIRQFNQTIPVIMFSANDTNETKKIAADHGATDFVGKPFELPHLIQTIKKHIKKT